uniref:Uncharacterized protein n=1 Tax=Anopheles arabiensis TaxID=7173 RepID=A0A182IGH7_ANOAR
MRRATLFEESINMEPRHSTAIDKSNYNNISDLRCITWKL